MNKSDPRYPAYLEYQREYRRVRAYTDEEYRRARAESVRKNYYKDVEATRLKKAAARKRYKAEAERIGKIKAKKKKINPIIKDAMENKDKIRKALKLK